MPLNRDPLGGFDSFDDAIRYRDAYGKAAEEREAAVMNGRMLDRDELGRRLLARLPADADEPTRRGTKDGATGERPAW